MTRSSRSILFLVSVATGALIASRAFARRRRQNRPVEGLSGPVTIRREPYGVPHIIAGSRDDALFGLGFAVASDRLWQLDLLRRKASGDLAQVAGPSELASDRMMRMAGLRDAARRSVAGCTTEACASLDAVCAGINHFMEHYPIPKVFRLAGYQPEPWTPADSVSVFLLMGWAMGGSMFQADLFAEQCRKVIGDEWTDAIFHGRSAEAPPSVREHVGPVKSPEADSLASRIFPEGGFSNSWAVSGERSVSGFPILAFDPHLEYTTPSVWYEAILEAPGFHVAGMTLPGLPGIGTGRTLTVAWGETSGMISQSFLYREELNEAGDAVRDGDTWVPLRIETQTIPVRGGEPETLRIRYTPRGPLISDILPGLTDGPVSLHWTGVEASTEPDLLFGLNTARSIDDVIAARRRSSVPVYNASVADVDGNVAQVVVGKIPVREPRAGLLDPSEFPPSYVPVDEMPLERNPKRGWVSGANNRLVGDDYPYPMFGVWEQPFRTRRISDVLESRSLHSVAEMRALQLDQYSLHAAELTPVVLDLVDGHAPAWVLEDLRGWDFESVPESRPAAVFQAFYTRWMQVSLLHRFPPEYLSSGVLSSGAGSVPRDFCDRLLTGDYPAWFDHQDGVRQTLARAALDEALQWLRDQLGDDPATWRWGDLNQLTFVHPLAELPGPQGRVLTVGPFGMGGDRTTIWPTAWSSTDDFRIRGGPSMRLIADLRRPELTWVTNTLGQSESPWSRYYRDQMSDFLEGRLHRLWPGTGKRRQRVILRPG